MELKKKRHLLFYDRGQKFALAAENLKEILAMPNLSSLASAGPGLVGVFPYRGTLLTVSDIGIQQGAEPIPYQVGDHIIIVEKEGKKIGIHIEDVVGVFDIEITSTSDSNTGLIQSLAKMGDEPVQVINIDAILSGEDLSGSNNPRQGSGLERFKAVFGHFSSEEIEILQTRTLSYSITSGVDIQKEFIPLAVLRVGTELIGLELVNIQEFADVTSFTSIPCVPLHISGCMNLRGEIFPLLDIHVWAVGKPNTEPKKCKAVVIKNEEKHFGILVNELMDVLYIQKAEILESTVMDNTGFQSLLKGIITNGEKRIGILNLDLLLSRKELVVDDN